MGVHRASHHLVRRPLQNVPLWGRLLTCGGLAIRLPPSTRPLPPSENRSALFAACRYVGQFVKLRATWRIPRQTALRAGYQAARSRGSACPTARGLRFLGGLGTLAVFRPALLLRRRDSLARRRAQDALATGWLRRRGRGRRNGFAFQRGLNLPDLFFDPLFLNLIARSERKSTRLNSSHLG